MNVADMLDELEKYVPSSSSASNILSPIIASSPLELGLQNESLFSMKKLLKEYKVQLESINKTNLHLKKENVNLKNKLKDNDEILIGLESEIKILQSKLDKDATGLMNKNHELLKSSEKARLELKDLEKELVESKMEIKKNQISAMKEIKRLVTAREKDKKKFHHLAIANERLNEELKEFKMLLYEKEIDEDDKLNQIKYLNTELDVAKAEVNEKSFINNRLLKTYLQHLDVRQQQR